MRPRDCVAPRSSPETEPVPDGAAEVLALWAARRTETPYAIAIDIPVAIHVVLR